MSGPPEHSLPTAFFDAFYAQGPDPWNFARSPYEARKYAATLAALPRPRYRNAFELGCSIGVLTAQLAPRCDRLLAMDAATAPLAEARRRTAAFPQVEVVRGRVPEDWPRGARFDLILLSEVLYYFVVPDLVALAPIVAEALEPRGHLVLVHWLPVAEPPYPLTGEKAVTAFRAALGEAVAPVLARREALYRLDVWERR